MPSPAGPVPQMDRHFRRSVPSINFDNLLKLSETLHKLHSHALIHWVKSPDCRLPLQGYEFILSAKIWWEKTGDDCLLVNLARAPVFCPDKGPHLAHIHTGALKPQVKSNPEESHRKPHGKPWFPTTIRYYHEGLRCEESKAGCNSNASSFTKGVSFNIWSSARNIGIMK